MVLHAFLLVGELLIYPIQLTETMIGVQKLISGCLQENLSKGLSLRTNYFGNRTITKFCLVLICYKCLFEYIL